MQYDESAGAVKLDMAVLLLQVRSRLQELLTDPASMLLDPQLRKQAVVPLVRCSASACVRPLALAVALR